jgi:hypothetical protein
VASVVSPSVTIPPSVEAFRAFMDAEGLA